MRLATRFIVVTNNDAEQCVTACDSDVYLGNKSQDMFCDVFDLFYLKGELHYVEIMCDFLSTMYVNQILCSIFLTNCFILMSPCPFNCEC